MVLLSCTQKATVEPNGIHNEGQHIQFKMELMAAVDQRFMNRWWLSELSRVTTNHQIRCDPWFQVMALDYPYNSIRSIMQNYQQHVIPNTPSTFLESQALLVGSAWKRFCKGAKENKFLMQSWRLKTEWRSLWQAICAIFMDHVRKLSKSVVYFDDVVSNFR